MTRRVLFQIHWFLGITAGLVLAVMGITGATMAFKDEIEAALSPGIVTVAPSAAPAMAPDALVAAASAQIGGARVRQLILYSDPARAAEVTFVPRKGVRRGQHSYVDPRTGRLLGPATGEAFFDTVLDIHRWLALPGGPNGIGRQITGIAAMSLVFFALSGLYLRWPRQPLDWRAWLVLDLKKTGRNLYRALHATIGGWLVAFYLLSALTGLTWSYDWYKSGVVFALTGKVGGSEAREKSGKRNQGAEVAPPALAPAWAEMLRSDGSRYARAAIAIPAGEGPVVMRVLPRGARFDRMTDELRFNAKTGALIKAQRYAKAKIGKALAGNFYALHTGQYFGLIGRILLMLSSATMPLFTVTGFLLYFARRRTKRALAAVAMDHPPATGASGADLLVIHASQTGNAERIARLSAAAFPGADVKPLGAVEVTALRKASRALFVVSTYGDGEAPDPARAFSSRVMSGPVDLADLDYAVLALGDREYGDFCAFGHRVDSWLHASGGRRLFDVIEVDGRDPDAERHWQQQLAAIAGHAIEPDWSGASYAGWTLTEREHVNPGSLGEPVYRIVLAPETPATWEPGAIAEVLPRHDPARIDRWLERAGRSDDADLRAALADKVLPDAPTMPIADLRPLAHRDYSIASIASSGAIELLVRLSPAEDGGFGIGSGWLCLLAAIGESVSLRIRANPSFTTPADPATPIVLIGNGTGIAGLIGHLRHRSPGDGPAWLLFGERSAAYDRPYRTELAALAASGVLERCDLAFSRDAECGRYVQDLLAAAADDVQDWADRGAAFYVCGSLAGMAAAVDATLRAILGDDRVEALLADGRYRRDIY